MCIAIVDLSRTTVRETSAEHRENSWDVAQVAHDIKHPNHADIIQANIATVTFLFLLIQSRPHLCDFVSELIDIKPMLNRTHFIQNLLLHLERLLRESQHHVELLARDEHVVTLLEICCAYETAD